jgi:hypothetical protein
MAHALHRLWWSRDGSWTEQDARPRHRRADRVLWLHPRQRWNETVVAGLVMREQVRRGLRSMLE